MSETPGRSDVAADEALRRVASCEVPGCFSGDVRHYYRTGTEGSIHWASGPVGGCLFQAGRHHIWCVDHASTFHHCAAGHRRRVGQMPMLWEGDHA